MKALPKDDHRRLPARLLLIFAFLLTFLGACSPRQDQKTALFDKPTPAPATATLGFDSIQTKTKSPTSTPESAPFTPTSTAEIGGLKAIEAELIAGVDWYLQIEDRDGMVLFSRNPAESFPPASMIKVPTAMAVLKILQNEGKTLPDIQNYGINGRNFAALLEAMVVRSEENATDALEFFARGDNRLRRILDDWQLDQTTFDPRRSSVEELIRSLRLLDNGEALTEEYRDFLLELMGMFTENDRILLGKLSENLPECQFLNKRGTLLNPTIAADMGILRCGQKTWYLVIAGTPAAGSDVTFEEIQASIESFAELLADYFRVQLSHQSYNGHSFGGPGILDKASPQSILSL